MNISDVTVVFQGAFKAHAPRDGKPFAQILKRTRQALPGAQIVVSTWAGTEVPGLFGIDHVVHSVDPGALAPLKLTDDKANNINRQIVSTRAGLAAVQTRYVVKMRTDCLLDHAGFIDFFVAQARRDGHERRIVAGAFFTLDATVLERIPYHVSDWFQFGLTEVLRDYWRIPLMTPAQGRHYESRVHAPHSNVFERRFRAEFAVEQYLALPYARQRGYLCPQYLNDIRPEVRADYQRFLAQEVLVLDPWHIGLVFPKYTWVNDSLVQRINNFMHLDWLALSPGHPGFDDAKPEFLRALLTRRRRLKALAGRLFDATQPLHGLIFGDSPLSRVVRRQAMRVFRLLQRLVGAA